jgi:hypothetical protein
MAKLNMELRALVAKFLIDDYNDYTITITTNFQPTIILVYEYKDLKGQIHFHQQIDRIAVQCNFNFIQAFINRTLQDHQLLFLSDFSRDDQLVWINSSLNLHTRMAVVQLPQMLVPIIVKIASYVNLEELVNENHGLSAAEIDQSFQAKLNQLRADLVNNKFKTIK